VKRFFEIALGIVTSIAGFLEAGSIATAAQAGAVFGFQLVWAIVLGTICVVFLIEMSGRLAAVGKHPLPAAVRERLGWNYFVIPLVAETIVDFLILTAEIGGACVGLQLLSGIAFPWWAIPVALLGWLLLWYGNFSLIEYGVCMLGLVTVAFLVGAAKLHPNYADLARGVLPSLPTHDNVHYWFLAVSILGATISPYLFNFYSSGAVEDQWDESHLWPNRITAALGMGFGGVMSLAVLVCAACVLHWRGIRIERYEQVALILTEPLGIWGYRLFGAGLFIACFGAALEIALDTAYVYAQTFGWNWGENEKPNHATRFSTVFSIVILLAAIPVVCGVDPLAVTLLAMAATAVILPFVVLPFLVLANDPHYVGEHTNGWLSNTVILVVIVLAFVIAVVSVPLEILGGS
jgi:Mn2+/Fe2+ NRAMP family transporter